MSRPRSRAVIAGRRGQSMFEDVDLSERDIVEKEGFVIPPLRILTAPSVKVAPTTAPSVKVAPTTDPSVKVAPPIITDPSVKVAPPIITAPSVKVAPPIITAPRPKTADEEVEEELIKSGYTPVSKIVVSKNGELEGKYIKALNKYGQYVYVELDTEGVLAIDGDIITHTEVKDATEIPLVDAYKCVEGGVCGVASECEGGVCTLTRTKGSKYPRQTTLVRQERSTDTSTSAMLGDDMVAYPVVRLSEIRADPENALFAQNEATTLLRDQRNVALDEDLAKMAILLNTLTDEFNEFQDIREDLILRVNSDLTRLEEANVTYVMSPPATVTERNDYEFIVTELKRRNDIVIDLLKCAAEVASQRDELRRLIDDIRKAKRECLADVDILDYGL